MSQPIILRVAIPSPLHRLFDYLPPADDAPPTVIAGVRVRVPFGKRELTGIVIETAAQSQIPASQLKKVSAWLDREPVLDAGLLALTRWAAEYYRYPLGMVLQAVLPAALRQGRSAHAKTETVWHAAASPEAAALSRAPRQQAILAWIATQQDGVLHETLLAKFPRSQAALRTLSEKGLVRGEQHRIVDQATPSADGGPVLNDAQQQAVEAVLNQLGSFKAFLLDGVTGSGKTEVYLHTIHQVLQRGGQALVLVPEIGLTPQLVARFRERLGGHVHVYHSGLTDTQRLATWLAAREGSAGVIIGTRSAVFLPFRSLGIAIVDEEHDHSFKQQDGFRYSARDIAVVRASRAGVPVVLGSATASLESWQNATAGRYQRLRLPERAGTASHPAMRLLDIRSRPLKAGMSDLLTDAIRRHLDNDSQVLLFLNRRGYAPTLACHDCGSVCQCSRCDAHMTLHRKRARLVCHHCGAERPVPEYCQSCGSENMCALGQGTERLEQALQELFPGTGILRMDRDSTRSPGKLERLLTSVREARRQILVGTQMLAKGHDFPDVTLVGVINADQGLFGTDFRAAENMAQLVIQVAGRAGRASRSGEVLIQTHHPDHPLLRQLVGSGYPGFVDEALRERSAAALPPFSVQALLRAEAAGERAALRFLDKARKLLEPAADKSVFVLGPAPAPMERRAGRYRAQLLLQSPSRKPLQRTLARIIPELESLPESRRVRWSIDVDPVSLM